MLATRVRRTLAGYVASSQIIQLSAAFTALYTYGLVKHAKTNRTNYSPALIELTSLELKQIPPYSGKWVPT